MQKAQKLPLGIRRATPDDAKDISLLHAAVQALHSAAYPQLFKPPSAEAFPPPQVEELMADLDHFFFVAEEKGESVGYLYAEIRDRPETPLKYAEEQIHIHQLAVKPACQRRGHGARLVLAAKTLMQQFDISTVTLSTWAFNHDAQVFYKQMGFTPMYHYLWIREVDPDSAQQQPNP